MLRELLKEKSILLELIEFHQDRYDGYYNLRKVREDLDMSKLLMRYQQALSILKQKLYKVNLLIDGKTDN